MSRVILIPLLCAAALALPSAAATTPPPAGTYTGTTSQGHPLTLTVDDAGTVRAPDVGYDFSCTSGDVVSGSTAFANGQGAQIVDNAFTIGDPGSQLRGTFTVTPGAPTTVSGSFEWSFTDEDDGDSCATGSVTFTATGPATAAPPPPPPPPPPEKPVETPPGAYTPNGQLWLAVFRSVVEATQVHPELEPIAVSTPAPAAISIDAAVIKVAAKIPVVTTAPGFAEVGGRWVIRANGAASSVVPAGAQVFAHSSKLLGYTSGGTARRSSLLLSGRGAADAKGSATVVMRPSAQMRQLVQSVRRSLRAFRAKKHRTGKVIVLARVTFTPPTGPRVTFLKLAALAL
jgi:hypothetical protein